MRHIALFSGISLALLAPLAAVAADTASLQVTGSISPAVCGVSMVGSSEVLLGTINLSDFTPGEDLQLEEKTASLKIDCQNGAAQFRLKATDGVNEGTSTVGPANYSLGRNTQGGKNKLNGYFTLSIDSAAMASNKFVLKSTDQGAGQAWGTPATGAVLFDHDGEAFAFADASTATEPAKLTSLTVPLKIAAVLAKDPIVGEEVALAGQATIEIFY
jgi:type 1 fimbria pilin